MFHVVDAFIDLFGIDFDDTVFVDLILAEEIHEMDRALFLEFIKNFAFVLGEAFQGDFVDVILHLILFLVVREFVHERAFTFVAPERDQEHFGLES